MNELPSRSIPLVLLLLAPLVAAQEVAIEDFGRRRRALEEAYRRAASPAEKRAIVAALERLDLRDPEPAAPAPEPEPEPASRPAPERPDRFGPYDPRTGLSPEELAEPGFLFELPFSLGRREYRTGFAIGAGFSDYQYYPVDGIDRKPLDDPRYGDYIHRGIDFRVPAGTPVFAIRGGRVTLSTGMRRHSSVTIEEIDAGGEATGRRWVYAHIDPETIPPAVRRAAAAGRPIDAGTGIGKVVDWFENMPGMPDQIDASDGRRYDHLHLDLIVKGRDGQDRYFDPAPYLPISDAVAPTIEAIHFTAAGSTTALGGQRPVLSGRIDVVLKAFDRIDAWREEEDGRLVEVDGGSPFRLGVHRVEVEIAPAGGGPAVHRSAVSFDHVDDGWREVADAYRRQLTVDGRSTDARGDRFGRRNFLVATRGSWDTTAVPDGRYEVRVTVADAAGNTSRRSVVAEVRN